MFIATFYYWLSICFKWGIPSMLHWDHGLEEQKKKKKKIKLFCIQLSAGLVFSSRNQPRAEVRSKFRHQTRWALVSGGFMQFWDLELLVFSSLILSFLLILSPPQWVYPHWKMNSTDFTAPLGSHLQISVKPCLDWRVPIRLIGVHYTVGLPLGLEKPIYMHDFYGERITNKKQNIFFFLPLTQGTESR